VDLPHRRRGREREDDLLLPYWPTPLSNGEFVPAAPTNEELRLARTALERAVDAADRIGMDRRRFLQGAGGMAAVLATLNLAACSGSTRQASRRPSTTRSTKATTTTRGGTYTVPPPEDVPACENALGDHGEFIFDVHTHHVIPDGPWRQELPGIASMIMPLVPASCTEADPFVCLDRQAYVQDLLLASDTTVTVLSDVPNSGDGDAALPFAEKVKTQELVASLSSGGAPRVLVQDIVAPNFGDVNQRLDLMTSRVEGGHVAAFKVYTAWGPGGRGYSLEDPKIGLPVVERALSLGIKVFCGHKGLPIQGFDQTHNDPRDMVAVAKQYPDMDFVVYHSGFERETYEGPYDPNNATRGTNSLLKALDDYGIPRNANVYADLGTAWRETMRKPDQAAHVLGKLLKRVGEERVLWGTDAIWYGSPQPQIMAFRSFQITPAYQEKYGYPALTDEIKRKVLGLNAAKLYGLDPTETRCALDASKITAARYEFQDLVAQGAVDRPWRPRGPVTRRAMLQWLTHPATDFSPF
jgi:hypothetical protein